MRCNATHFPGAARPRRRVDGAAAGRKLGVEPIVGVFNRTCLINYDNYRNDFPLWALGEWPASASA